MTVHYTATPMGRSSISVGSLIWLALCWPADAGAQVQRPPRGSPPAPISPPTATGQLLPDLVAVPITPQVFVESYTDESPCTTHTHSRTARLQLGGRFTASLPARVAALYRNGQMIDSWSPMAGSPPIDLGTFSWTFTHECSGGGVSNASTPANNHRLVVDPDNRLIEASEENNVIEFYVPSSATWSKN